MSETVPTPPETVPVPRRPRRVRVLRLVAVVVLALLLGAYAVKIVATPGAMLFDVGVDNREPDWVKVTEVSDSSVLVLADGRRYRALARADGTPALQADDLFEYDVRAGEVYADVEPSSERGSGHGVQIELHYAWARCGNSFFSPNPFDSVPHYRRLRAQFPAERVTSE